jgi:hypothetical protein
LGNLLKQRQGPKSLNHHGRITQLTARRARSSSIHQCRLAEATGSTHLATNGRVRPAASEDSRSKHGGGLRGWPVGRGNWRLRLRQHASRPDEGALSSPRTTHGGGRADCVDEGRGSPDGGDEANQHCSSPCVVSTPSSLLEKAGAGRGRGSRRRWADSSTARSRGGRSDSGDCSA